MNDYTDRSIYRANMQAKDLVFYGITHLETDLYIGSKINLGDTILPAVKTLRTDLDAKIKKLPHFNTSLTPIALDGNDKDSVKNMCRAAALAGVGPMATVAGAFCAAVYDAVKNKTDELIVENGGDLLVCTQKKRTIALYAGTSPLSMRLGLNVVGDGTPLGICSSAGTIGHSISFGKADLAMCISRNVYFADAAATQLGNWVKKQADLAPAVERILGIEGIMGAIAVMGDQIAAVGAVDLTPL